MLQKHAHHWYSKSPVPQSRTSYKRKRSNDPILTREGKNLYNIRAIVANSTEAYRRMGRPDDAAAHLRSAVTNGTYVRWRDVELSWDELLSMACEKPDV